MELLQLKYFQVAAQLEHFTKAADQLHISQPSLSKTIHSLEIELGTPLFNRTGKSVRLNEAGIIFLKKIDIALSALDDGKSELLDMKNKHLNHISLAFLAGSPVMPELLSEFCKKYPDVNFNLYRNLSAFPRYNFDICISILPLEIDGLSSIPLLSEEIFLAVPITHHLACKKSISLKEAAGEKFIQLKPDNEIRKLCDHFCLMAGFYPNTAFESDDPATVRGLIKAGQGVGFVPAISWGVAEDSNIKLLSIKDPSCFRTIGISWIENRYHPDIIIKFRDFAINYYKVLKIKRKN